MAFKMKGHSLPGPHQRKSPAKCPLLAAAPAIIGAVGAMKKKKEEDSPATHRQQRVVDVDHTHEKGRYEPRPEPRPKPSPVKKAGIFTTDIDELTGEETERRISSKEAETAKNVRRTGEDIITDDPRWGNPKEMKKLKRQSIKKMKKEGTYKTDVKEQAKVEAAQKKKDREEASPAKRADVYIDGENIGTGSEARAKAHKVAQENVKLQHKQDVAGVDAESPEYDTGKKITYDKIDKEVNEQAVKDLEKMQTDPYGGRFFRPESTDEERRRAVSTDKYQSVPAETNKQSKARRRKAKLKA
jgi:hypothetical protein